MLEYSIMQAQGILVLKPHGPLSAEDFAGVSPVVDAYLARYPKLRGVMIQSKGFPGWENFGAFTAHLHFVRAHHKQVERIAVVTDSPVAAIAESLGKHFTSADVMHFPFANSAKALSWLGSVSVTQ